MAATLRRIAKAGRAGFYEGPVADDMVARLRALGGLHTLEDFASQQSVYETPISVTYADTRFMNARPTARA
jgi:gamma-glutamyltranspeptidase/glutathione hydrolase